MTPLDYFKLQAKNLLRDYKTQTSYSDVVDSHSYFTYTPKYFDIERIFLEFDWNEENFSLMEAQHLFSLLLGFRKWSDLLTATNDELELAKLLWDHQNKIGREDWNAYIVDAEINAHTSFNIEDKIEIFKEVFVNAPAFPNQFADYRIKTLRS